MNPEIFRALVKMAIKQAKQITDDQEALSVQILFPEWKKQLGRDVTVGEYLQHEGKLYKVLQAHTLKAELIPGIANSLFTVINYEHAGTISDPIPAASNMKYFKNKFYIEDEKIYKCIKDSEVNLRYLPSKLVGSFFELI